MTQSDETTPTTDPATDPATPQAPDAAEETSPGSQEGDAPPAKKATARKTAARKTTAKKATTRKSAAKKTAAKTAQTGDDTPADASAGPSGSPDEPGEAPQPAKKASSRRTTKKTAAQPDAQPAEQPAADDAEGASTGSGAPAVLFQAPESTTAPRRRTRKAAAAAPTGDAPGQEGQQEAPEDTQPDKQPDRQQAPKKTAKKTQKKSGKKADQAEPESDAGSEAGPEAGPDAGIEAGESGPAPKKSGKKSAKKSGDKSGEKDEQAAGEKSEDGESDSGAEQSGESTGEAEGGRRRRRRGGRRRRKGSGDDTNGKDDSDSGDGEDDDEDGDEGGSRRRRTRNRQPKSPEDEITSVSGSTRLEAKKQRRREGREAGRRRAPIVSEAEFLARREAVDRTMVIRQKDDLTQIGVLEDKVLVEHYVARESQTSLIGNIYLGRVQNVLPSMEAAFVDIGKGRNAVLYAGEVNWKALGHKDGQARKIESVLSSGQTVLVQVTKDPIGHKGARLTGQISLPGRFLVYVPDGTTSGISRKLPDTERNRLKTLLKEIVPDTAGVIVRTAAEGASEEELTRDVERLTARWSDIEKKVQSGKGPELLYGEPDLTLKVIRDLFTEDFARLVVQGDDAWDLVDGYVSHVAPDLRDRLERFEVAEEGPDAGKDVFAAYRVDEQIAKGLDRKVWLPSGGSLVIDRTEAMTVVDVNTGKFTGSGGNLEETVTKNNLEAAEEIVRQLRLRDIGGIIVVDFIDMVLESNRDLVLRRLVECLGRDRTRHQVAEVTSLGLVQMTRKRIGTGLLEAFGEECQHCKGRGVLIHDHPIEPSQKAADEPRGRRSRGGRSRGKGGDQGETNGSGTPAKPSPKDLAGSRPPTERPEAPDSVPPTAEPAPDAALDSGLDPGLDPALNSAPATKAEDTTDGGPATGEAAAPATGEQSATEQPAAEPPTEPPTEQLAEEPVDTAPKVVVTRRRRAARPAGPPAGEAVAPSEGPADHSSDHSSDQPSGQALGVSADGSGPGHASAAPEGEPRSHDDEPAEDNSSSLVHVPIKKKGTRKR